VLTLRTARTEGGSAVTLLGRPEPLEWTQDGQELSIRLPAPLADPARRPPGPAWAFRIQTLP
jgi:hypothetical protein